MGSVGAPKRIQHIAAELPDDLVHFIFSKLDFKGKVVAGQVCKRWDRLLKARIAGARHWAVDYKVDTIDTMPSQASATAEQKQFTATIGRWLINRAAAIKVVHVSATVSSDQEGVATMNVLESPLPLLAGCLAKHVNRLELTFQCGSPFASSLLSSSAFLTFLCPMLKSLRLCCLEVTITASQFAAICELSSLEELYISEMMDAEQAGLEEMTSDISKLVNLKTLELHSNESLESIPESISCLQKLEVMYIGYSPTTEMPSGLARLASLSSLMFLFLHADGPLRLPPSLQGLRSLTSVDLEGCSLETIPEGLVDLSALTYLKLSQNHFQSSDGWSWWPTSLSRLTRLAELVMAGSDIVSLPPHISGLRQLTKLDINCNDLRNLPEQLSSLQNLRDLQANGNYLPTVPVAVLSTLTALTYISLRGQQLEGTATFKVISSLLPILQPGLVELDLRHFGQAWDPLSLCHLTHALAEIADRTPVPTLRFW